ncbi:MAG TPA: DUF2167 domain-containing protein [Burkholderiales bacterium]|jgi:uncharacterized membrane-anchored protein
MSTIQSWGRALLALLFVLPAIALAQPADPSGADRAEQRMLAELKKLQWQEGPTEGRIGTQASIKVPKDYVFLDEKNTRRFLEINGNPPADHHYMIAPRSLSWFAVFSFEESGYVKDDEKIDADSLLKSLKESDGPSNEQRKRLGMGSLYTVGWEVPPHYDNSTRRLEWGMRLRADDNTPVINYTSRLLGRKGVMSAILVSSPQTLAADTRAFQTALRDFDYVPGEKYSEYKSGDKIAEYGLAALILGGAAAVATKKGFWAVIGGFFAAFWKLLAGVAAAGFAGLRSMFRKKE